MSRWFRFYEGALDDPKVQRLPADLFKERFLAAVGGEPNEFSEFIKRLRDKGGQAWMKIRARIFERDDYACQYCGERGGRLECDHVLPVSRGGSDDDWNLATACLPCNRSKRDKTIQEWLAQ